MNPAPYDKTKRPLIYVAGPFRAASRLGIEGNKQRAREAAAVVWLLGGVPVLPHVQGEFVDGVIPEGQILGGLIQQMLSCHAVYAPLGMSPGTLAEVTRAREAGMPVVHDIDHLRIFIDAFMSGAETKRGEP